MKITAILMVGVIGAVAGCASQQVYTPTVTVRDVPDPAIKARERMAKINATDWPADIKALVIAEKIAIGMTPDQVEAARGTPRSKTTAGGVGDQIEIWHYYSSSLYFSNGELVRWVQTRRS